MKGERSRDSLDLRLLEDNFRSELQLPRRICGACNLAEVLRITDIVPRLPKYDSVEKIESLGAKLEATSLSNWKLFEY
jgi:hypothetical protein